MTAEQIKRAKEQAPFRPFTIFLSDQRQFRINHSDYLWLIPGGRTLAVAHDDGSAEIIDLIHVTSISAQGNGTP
jgi:hypothetical protein